MFYKVIYKEKVSNNAILIVKNNHFQNQINLGEKCFLINKFLILDEKLV